MLTVARYLTLPDCILGIALFDGKWIADTLELPWKDNHQFISCIPEGTYELSYSQSHRIGSCYEVRNVPGREGILIHPANKVSQLKGCIGAGVKCGNELYRSVSTLQEMFSVVGKETSLEVKRL